MAPPADAPAGARRVGLLVAVAGCLVLADQLTKRWALDALADGPIHLFWTLRLRLAFNTGMAFSVGSGRGALIAGVALAVVVVAFWAGTSATSRLGAVGVGLVLGGALGNLADRAFRDGTGFLGGAVVDFVDFQWWPVFNLADAGIVIGGALLVLVSWRHDEAAA